MRKQIGKQRNERKIQRTEAARCASKKLRGMKEERKVGKKERRKKERRAKNRENVRMKRITTVRIIVKYLFRQ